MLLGYTEGYDQNPLRTKATRNKIVQAAMVNAMPPYYTGGLGVISNFFVFTFSIMTVVMNCPAQVWPGPRYWRRRPPRPSQRGSATAAADRRTVVPPQLHQQRHPQPAARSQQQPSCQARHQARAAPILGHNDHCSQGLLTESPPTSLDQANPGSTSATLPEHLTISTRTRYATRWWQPQTARSTVSPRSPSTCRPRATSSTAATTTGTSTPTAPTTARPRTQQHGQSLW